MDVNLYGYVNITKYLLPVLKKTKGQLVVISSLSGILGLPLRTFYCSTKFAVNGFFNALHMEVGDTVSITQCNPTTVTGTKFRANGLNGVSEAAPPSKNNLTVE